MTNPTLTVADLAAAQERWIARPTSFAMELLDWVPDPWQAQSLIHLADQPPSLTEFANIYAEVRRHYRYASRAKTPKGRPTEEAVIALKNYESTKKWEDRAWLREDYAKPFSKVSICSGHGVGKSAVMAVTCLWLICLFYPLKVGCTAPTAHQLEDVLWAEIAKWHSKLPKWFRDRIVMADLRMHLVGHEKRCFAVARTARREQPEALQGLHEDNTGIIVDESSGVPDLVFQSSEGIMTAHSTRALLCSNPTRSQGFFYDTHENSEVRKGWYTLSVSCLESARVSPKFIRDIAARYGADSNAYRIRVLGKFPRTDDDACIPKYMIEDATEREVDPYPDSSVVWGLDPARFGDDRTALSMRQGNVKLGLTVWWSKQDTMQTAGRVIRLYEDTPPKQRPDDIVVDVIGIGAGVADRLREAGLPVTMCNVAETATNEEGYQRVYSELWWSCRQWFEAGDSRIPREEPFTDEIARPKYKILSNGKIVVESKSDVKKRVQVQQSPDLAESFILTFASTRGRIRRGGQKLKYPVRNMLSSGARRTG